MFEQIFEELDGLINKFHIESLPVHYPEKCFADETIDSQSIHFRFAYADGRRRASYYPLNEVPSNIYDLIEECRVLTRKVFEEQPRQKISGEEGLKHLQVTEKKKREFRSDVVVKIKIKSNGDILLNGRKVSIQELAGALDELKKENGAVWYYRESPNTKVTPELDKVIKVVLDEIIKRNLPIKFSEIEF